MWVLYYEGKEQKKVEHQRGTIGKRGGKTDAAKSMIMGAMALEDDIAINLNNGLASDDEIEDFIVHKMAALERGGKRKRAIKDDAEGESDAEAEDDDDDGPKAMKKKAKVIKIKQDDIYTILHCCYQYALIHVRTYAYTFAYTVCHIGRQNIP